MVSLKERRMKPKVVILAGGKGMRLYEETAYKPKPLVEIGHMAIIEHIMKIYMGYGFNDFIICTGYKGKMIENYFPMKSYKSPYSVTFVDTGLNTKTAGRIRQIKDHIDTEDFLLTYGDGVADIDINALYEFHKKHGKVATLTGIHPTSKFGEIVIDNGKVVEYKEKPKMNKYVSGGFYVFNKKFFDYLKDDCFFEQGILRQLVKEGELYAYKHDGQWECMDTYKDVCKLNEMWDKGEAKWK